MGVRGAFWNVPSVRVIGGRGGCEYVASGLECSWRACDIWAWWLEYLEVGWNVLGVLVVPAGWYVGVCGVGCGTAPAGCSKEYTPNAFYYNT